MQPVDGFAAAVAPETQFQTFGQSAENDKYLRVPGVGASPDQSNADVGDVLRDGDCIHRVFTKIALLCFPFTGAVPRGRFNAAVVLLDARFLAAAG